MDSNGRHTSVNSLTTNGQKFNENQRQNGTIEKINRNRPAGASAMNTRDPMLKQKLINMCEPGPLKRVQGRICNEI